MENPVSAGGGQRALKWSIMPPLSLEAAFDPDRLEDRPECGTVGISYVDDLVLGWSRGVNTRTCRWYQKELNDLASVESQRNDVARNSDWLAHDLRVHPLSTTTVSQNDVASALHQAFHVYCA